MGAPTEDAKRMARQKYREAQAEEKTPTERIQRKGAKDMDSDLSSAPKLSKSIQSQELLKQQAVKPGPLATAVKAKAAPKVETPVSPMSPQTSLAVAACLQRATTADLQSPAIQTPPPTQAPPNDDQSSESSSEEDEEELQRRAAEERARKEAHARYMRFSRSLKSILHKSMRYSWVILGC